MTKKFEMGNMKNTLTLVRDDAEEDRRKINMTIQTDQKLTQSVIYSELVDLSIYIKDLDKGTLGFIDKVEISLNKKIPKSNKELIAQCQHSGKVVKLRKDHRVKYNTMVVSLFVRFYKPNTYKVVHYKLLDNVILNELLEFKNVLDGSKLIKEDLYKKYVEKAILPNLDKIDAPEISELGIVADVTSTLSRDNLITFMASLSYLSKEHGVKLQTQSNERIPEQVIFGFNI